MTDGAPATVLEGALPASGEPVLPGVDQITTTGFTALIDRAISLACCASIVPLAIMGGEQLDSAHTLWLLVLGGGLLALSVLMPFYAWSRQGIKPLAALYAVLVLVALASWPLAWTGGASPGVGFFALPVGLATIGVAVAAGSQVAVGYGSVSALLYFVIRRTDAGGAAPTALALQDALLLVLQPAVMLLVLQELRQAVEALDRQLTAQHFEAADTLVDQALVDERRRLDALVHDEIMTTLVAGARSATEHDPHVAELARAALATLDAEASSVESEAPVSAEQLVRLVNDVVTSVCPQAQVAGEVPSAAVTLPQPVARALMQAAREAALNAEKHAHAAHVLVTVQVVLAARRLSVRLAIDDDGVGFDPATVPARRLGIRMSLLGRLESVGGTADVQSAPGRGTRVRLAWTGDRSRGERQRRANPAHVVYHPLFEWVNRGRVVLAGAVLGALYLMVGAIRVLTDPGAAFLPGTAVLALITLGVALRAVLVAPISLRHGCVVAALALAFSGWMVVTFERGPWPEHGGWFAALVMLVLVCTYVAGQPLPAWAAAAVHAVLVLAFASNDLRPSALLLTALSPLAWLGLTALVFSWLGLLWEELDDAEREAAASAQLNAALFGKLVLREVWLAELRSDVGPILTKLADVSQPLTDADREGLLLLEDSLRDGIKAANFSAPRLSAAIMAARRRGVTVTLVDNRGSRLPEPARRAALATLESIVREASCGRVVARTAPEGYAEAVTVLSVADGATRLTRITEEGTVLTDEPPPRQDRGE